MIKLRVREIAEGKGMTMQALSDKSGIAYSTIIDWWYDRARRIDKNTLNALCAALGVEPGELIVREVEATEKNGTPAGFGGSLVPA